MRRFQEKRSTGRRCACPGLRTAKGVICVMPHIPLGCSNEIFRLIRCSRQKRDMSIETPVGKARQRWDKSIENQRRRKRYTWHSAGVRSLGVDFSIDMLLGCSKEISRLMLLLWIYCSAVAMRTIFQMRFSIPCAYGFYVHFGAFSSRQRRDMSIDGLRSARHARGVLCL